VVDDICGHWYVHGEVKWLTVVDDICGHRYVRGHDRADHVVASMFGPILSFGVLIWAFGNKLRSHCFEQFWAFGCHLCDSFVFLSLCILHKLLQSIQLLVNCDVFVWTFFFSISVEVKSSSIMFLFGHFFHLCWSKELKFHILESSSLWTCF
jgi:hypothetical protein